jgi:hypothetical protein
MDEGEDYLFNSSKTFSSSKTKVAKPHCQISGTSETGVSSSSMLGALTSAPFIKTDDSTTITWSTVGFLTTNNYDILMTLSLPDFNLKKQMYPS